MAPLSTLVETILDHLHIYKIKDESQRPVRNKEAVLLLHEFTWINNEIKAIEGSAKLLITLLYETKITRCECVNTRVVLSQCTKSIKLVGNPINETQILENVTGCSAQTNTG